MSMTISLSRAYEMVRQVQNQYLRGELPEEHLADVLAIDPNAKKNWDKMKLNLRVRRRKLMKRAVDTLKAALHKSHTCKRYRPGKEMSTNSREKSKLDKIERQFYRDGLNVIETWVEFMAVASKRMAS